MSNANTAKNAAQAALEYFNEFYAGQGFHTVRLEEVEKTEGIWTITLGYDESGSSVIFPKRRQYKIFKIEDETFEVLSMKIRNLNADESV